MPQRDTAIYITTRTPIVREFELRSAFIGPHSASGYQSWQGSTVNRGENLLRKIVFVFIENGGIYSIQRISTSCRHCLHEFLIRDCLLVGQNLCMI